MARAGFLAAVPLIGHWKGIAVLPSWSYNESIVFSQTAPTSVLQECTAQTDGPHLGSDLWRATLPSRPPLRCPPQSSHPARGSGEVGAVGPTGQLRDHTVCTWEQREGIRGPYYKASNTHRGLTNSHFTAGGTLRGIVPRQHEYLRLCCRS